MVLTDGSVPLKYMKRNLQVIYIYDRPKEPRPTGVPGHKQIGRWLNYVVATNKSKKNMPRSCMITKI